MAFSTSVRNPTPHKLGSDALTLSWPAECRGGEEAEEDRDGDGAAGVAVRLRWDVAVCRERKR